jgi:hypothetical protein
MAQNFLRPNGVALKNVPQTLVGGRHMLLQTLQIRMAGTSPVHLGVSEPSKGDRTRVTTRLKDPPIVINH